MRIDRLDLIAFGPFTDRSLDLSAPGLHLVYGPNEAGKSTALRAITGLLFGIPERTGDAHVHSNQALRIGATLRTRDGALSVVRRKGRKRTLLDPGGDPMDEAPLQRALGGVSQALFEAMFGLNHETLRDGAQALLEGHADLGVNLFDAGGARGVGPLLGELRAEADELFKARGRTQRIHQAIAELGELRDRTKELTVEPRRVVEQREELEASQARHDTLRAERDERQARLTSLQRRIRTLPKLQRRRAILDELDGLGVVPRLPGDAAEQRLEATRRLEQAERDRRRLAGEIAQRRGKVEERKPSETLLAIDPTVLDEVESALGRHRSAVVDLPKRRGALRTVEDEIRGALVQLGEARAIDDVEALRIDKRLQARVAELGRDRGRVVAELEVAERQLRQAQEELNALGEPPVPVDDPEPLEAVMDRVRADGDLDARLRDLAAEEARLVEEAGALAARLEVGSWREASSWVVPARDGLAALVDRRRALDEMGGRFEERRRRCEEAIARVDGTIAALQEQGEIPTEEELARVRQERDEVWRRLADGEMEIIYLRDELSAAMRRADALADRLRQEADRVAQFAAQRADRSRHEAERAQLEEERRRLEEDRAALRQDEAALWEGLPTPRRGDATALLTWCDGAQQLRERVVRWQRCSDERASLAVRRTEAVRDLVEALGESQERGSDLTDVPLGRCLDRVRAQAQRLREGRVAVADDEARRRRAVAAVRSREEDVERCARQRERWQASWAEVLSQLGMPPDAGVEEVDTVLEARHQLFDKVAAAEQLRRRIEGMERDDAAFEGLVRPLVERALPQLAQAPLGEAAATLAEAARGARERARQCDVLEAEIREREAEVEGLNKVHEDAAATLESLRRAADVTSVDELATVEENVARHTELQRRLDEIERDLESEGPWRQLDESEEDPDRLKVEATALAHELAEREEVLTELAQAIGGQKAGLERLNDPSRGAHGVAARAEEKVAEIRRLSERWATLRLAERILGGEIDRYRQRNQGPIVDRASELFPRLTQGEYERLRVDFGRDDEPELRCVGVDGVDLGIDALSDGARDQLYLALRLASLEHYARQTDLLPLVADDIFVHFDEERVAASLEVLDGFCDVGQVLMFTHHHRHAEIAEEVLPSNRLTVHHLAGGHRRAAS